MEHQSEMYLEKFFENKVDFLNKYINTKNQTKLFAANITRFSLPDISSLKDLLGEKRINEINARRLDSDRKRMLLCDLLLFFTLNKYYGLKLNEISPYIIDFNSLKTKDENIIYFNKSHSSDMVVCAISDKRIGVDIQKHRAINYKKIANKYFSPDENKMISLSKKQNNVFFDIWCKKEASSKMKGTGILNYLNKKNDCEGHIYNLNIYKGYSVCLCEDNS